MRCAVLVLGFVFAVGALHAQGVPARLDAATYDSNENKYYFFSGEAVFVLPRKGSVGEPVAIDTLFKE